MKSKERTISDIEELCKISLRPLSALMVRRIYPSEADTIHEMSSSMFPFPLSQAYGALRKRMIELSDKYDFEKIRKADKKEKIEIPYFGTIEKPNFKLVGPFLSYRDQLLIKLPDHVFLKKANSNKLLKAIFAKILKLDSSFSEEVFFDFENHFYLEAEADKDLNKKIYYVSIRDLKKLLFQETEKVRIVKSVKDIFEDSEEIKLIELSDLIKFEERIHVERSSRLLSVKEDKYFRQIFMRLNDQDLKIVFFSDKDLTESLKENDLIEFGAEKQLCELKVERNVKNPFLEIRNPSDKEKSLYLSLALVEREKLQTQSLLSEAFISRSVYRIGGYDVKEKKEKPAKVYLGQSSVFSSKRAKSFFELLRIPYPN